MQLPKYKIGDVIFGRIGYFQGSTRKYTYPDIEESFFVKIKNISLINGEYYYYDYHREIIKETDVNEELSLSEYGKERQYVDNN